MSITGIQLRSSHWQAMTVTLGGTKGKLLLDKIQNAVGFYPVGGDANDIVAFITQADKALMPKKVGSGEAIAQGADVYYDSGTGKLTGVSGTLCGRCLEAAGANDTEVLVAFDGLAAA